MKLIYFKDSSQKDINFVQHRTSKVALILIKDIKVWEIKLSIDFQEKTILEVIGCLNLEVTDLKREHQKEEIYVRDLVQVKVKTYVLKVTDII